jgi:hypothetical protein
MDSLSNDNINFLSIKSNSYNNLYNSQEDEENNNSIENFLPNEFNKIGEGGFGCVYKSQYNILVVKK